jgi:hypothetical protein
MRGIRQKRKDPLAGSYFQRSSELNSVIGWVMWTWLTSVSSELTSFWDGSPCYLCIVHGMMSFELMTCLQMKCTDISSCIHINLTYSGQLLAHKFCYWFPILDWIYECYSPWSFLTYRLTDQHLNRVQIPLLVFRYCVLVRIYHP